MQSEGCYAIAAGVGYAFDEPVEAESAQVVAELALGHGVGPETQQGCVR